MTDPWDLNAQMAQRLFGWTWGRCSARCWYAQDGFHTADGAHVWHLPAYTTDPAATALVWQWVETRGAPMHRILMDYLDGEAILCTIQMGRHDVEAEGATWPEALCRAALAMADALEQGEGL